MKLSDYMNAHGISDAEFARCIGVTREAVRRYRMGLRIPARAVMLRIAEVTGGAVTPADFYGIGAEPGAASEKEVAR